MELHSHSTIQVKIIPLQKPRNVPAGQPTQPTKLTLYYGKLLQVAKINHQLHQSLFIFYSVKVINRLLGHACISPTQMNPDILLNLSVYNLPFCHIVLKPEVNMVEVYGTELICLEHFRNADPENERWEA